jgi:[ribosomal protein S5]-alanine N-acetyltransferase
MRKAKFSMMSRVCLSNQALYSGSFHRVYVSSVRIGVMFNTNGIALGEGVFSRTAELGYWLGEPFWGCGIMSDAVGHVAPYVITHYGLCRLQAAVYEWNPGSMRVLERCGFTREGVARANVYKDGRVIDEVIYALIDARYG